jgi:hypothetical protein
MAHPQDKEPDEREIAKRRDEALKRALGMPHKPHKPSVPKGKKAPAKKCP